MSAPAPMSIKTLDSLRNDEALEDPKRLSQRGTPTWEVAWFYPLQGEWEESDYLSLTTNWMIEFDDGCIDVLPMPTLLHQRIVDFFIEQLKQVIRQGAGGEVISAPVPVRLWKGKHRQPDVFYLKPGRVTRGQDYPDGSDLVVEVVSEGSEARVRDYETKRGEYARAGIPEYWIIDPQQQLVTVLTLVDDEYQTHGEFRPGETARSVLLDGFQIDVTAIFRAAQGPESADA